VDEVEAPRRVRPIRDGSRRSNPKRAFAPAATTHHELFLAIEPLHALLVRRPSFAPQQHVEPAIAKATSLVRERFEPGAQGPVVDALGLVADARPVDAHQGARPPLAHLEGADAMSHGFALCGGSSGD